MTLFGAALNRAALRRSAGFTMVELVVVIVLIGILAGIGYSRFADNAAFENRAYADQARNVIRYAQKLAIAQNRVVFVRSQPAGFAICFQSGCTNASQLASAPGGSNGGSAASRAFCTVNNAYVSSWMCEGRPNAVIVASDTNRPEFGAAGFFYFDGLGRPYNRADPVGASNFTRMQLSFSNGATNYTVTIEPETGYVH